MSATCNETYATGLSYHDFDFCSYPLKKDSFASYKIKKEDEQKKCIVEDWKNTQEFSFYVTLPDSEVFIKNQNLQNEYISLLIEEIKLYASILQSKRVLGFELKGKNSLLFSAENLKKLTEAIKNNFVFKDDVSLSIETKDIILATDRDAAQTAYEAGYRRLSICFSCEEEKLSSCEKAFSSARLAGFRKINADILYDLQSQNEYTFDTLLQKAISLMPEYITVNHCVKSKDEQIDFYKDTHLYRIAYRTLLKNGYRAAHGKRTFTKIDYDYGTSDFLTSLIIKGVPYIGMGLSSKTFGNEYSSTNFSFSTKDFEKYKKNILAKEFPVCDVYKLPVADCMAHFVVKSFLFGFIDLKAFQKKFNTDFTKTFSAQISFLTDLQLMEKVGYRFCLTERGIDYLHGIVPLFYSATEKKVLKDLLNEKQGNKKDLSTSVEDTNLLETNNPLSQEIEEHNLFAIKTITALFSFCKKNEENYRKNPEPELFVLLEKKVFGATEKWSLPYSFVRKNETALTSAFRAVENCIDCRPDFCKNMELIDTNKTIGDDAYTTVPFFSIVKNTVADKTILESDKNIKWFSVLFNVDKKNNVHLVLANDKEKLSATAKVTEDVCNTISVVCKDCKGLSIEEAKLLISSLYMLKVEADKFCVLFEFLPKKFTLAELQKLQELLLGKEVIGPNFRRKVSEFVEETSSYTSGTGHRPAKLFVRK